MTRMTDRTATGIVLGLALAAASSGAFAESDSATASVISITSGVASAVESRRQCWRELTTEAGRFAQERQKTEEEASWFTPFIVPAAGGAMGAVVGNRFGGGRGKKLLTVAGGAAGAKLGPGAVLGAVVGVQIGGRIGKGRGNTAAKLAGAIAGGMLGKMIFDKLIGGIIPYYDTEEPEHPERVIQVERCGMVDSFAEVHYGYRVVYVHDSREYVVDLPYDPGDTVKLAAVQPISRPAVPEEPRRGPAKP